MTKSSHLGSETLRSKAARTHTQDAGQDGNWQSRWPLRLGKQEIGGQGLWSCSPLQFLNVASGLCMLVGGRSFREELVARMRVRASPFLNSKWRLSKTQALGMDENRVRGMTRDGVKTIIEGQVG